MRQNEGLVMAKILSGVGSSLVAVIAGAIGYQVTIAQTPGTVGGFQVYDANQNLLATIPSSGPGSYQWGSASGAPFSSGQTVGFVSVPSGTQNFIVTDSNPVPYFPPLNIGGVYPAAGAIGQRTGRVMLTGATAQAYTLAAPTPGADDFKEMEIVNVTAQAHTVTGPANCYNGTTHIATFAAAVGGQLVVIAYNGVWYVQVATGNGVTLS
jgi:hypothetical protein